MRTLCLSLSLVLLVSGARAQQDPKDQYPPPFSPQPQHNPMRPNQAAAPFQNRPVNFEGQPVPIRRNVLYSPPAGHAPIGHLSPPSAEPKDPITASVSDQVESAEEVRKEEQQEELGTLAERVEQTLKEVEESEALEEAEKAERLEYLRKAQKWLANAEEYKAKTNEYADEAKQAPAKLAETKGQLEQALPDPQPAYEAEATLAQLERSLGQAEGQLKTAQEELATQTEKADSTARTERKAKIAEQKDAAKKKLEEAEVELKGAGSSDGSEAMSAARRFELEVRIVALTRQVEQLDAERTRHEAFSELQPVLRDLAQRRATWCEKHVEAWREVVTEFRKAESARQAEEARRVASQAHPAVRELAERNAKLAESRTQLARDMEAVSGDLESVRKTLEALQEDFKGVSSKVEVAGMTPTVGLLLRDRGERLPNLRTHRERIQFSGAEMQRVQVELLDLESERKEMGDLDERIEQVIGELGSASAQFDSGYLENMVRDLMRDRQEYLKGLLGDYRSYHDDLNELDLATRELLKQVATYRAFVDENVLWIRSTDAISHSDFLASWPALIAFLDVQRWQAVLGNIWQNVSQHPLSSAALLVAFIALVVFRRRMRNRLETLAEQVSGLEDSSVLPTLQAFALSVLLAAVWPLAFWGIGWWLNHNHQASDLALGLSRGLQAVAVVYFAVELFRQVCRPGGLAEKHFDWQTAWIQPIYRSLSRLLLLGPPVVLLVMVIDAFDGGAWRDSLGRLAFLAGLFVSTAFQHKVFHPWKGVVQVALAESPMRWPARFRYVWYALAVGFPVALMVLVGLGYTYSAERLVSRFQLMVFLVLGTVLGQALLIRAMAVAWRRLVALRASKEPQPNEASAQDEFSEIPLDESQETDVHDVGLQLGQLVRGLSLLVLAVGTWFVWVDMFPALQVFDRIELWSTTRMVSETITSADGAVTTETVPKTVPVTLVDLLFVAVILVGTLVTARTLPGLLEIAVLGRLPIDTGARHAIVMVSRYIVTLLGVLTVCRMLGMTWSSVQWLLAAMTVGLGFGLQEIFANLVSGLIILFERPIRIGDLVTVNGTTGRVTRMQIRSTTITDFDRRELVVPNKRFITDDVVNWTLSDPVTRFVIPVGISYGSNPKEAHELLVKVAKEHSLVLDDPSPTAVFVGFGDSTLNLELRVFLGNREHYPTALHELNLTIEQTLREADIEIAFPQQDIHIRDISIQGLPNVLSFDNANNSQLPKAA